MRLGVGAPRIDVGARDLAAVVEAESWSWEAWNVDRREAAFLEEKAVAAAARVLVDPQDLPAGVDSQRQRSQGPQEVDGLVSPSLEEETVDDEADGVVAAHDPPPVVDAVRSPLRDGIRVIVVNLPRFRRNPGLSGSTGLSVMQLTGGGSVV
jgi:hypothetical protein